MANAGTLSDFLERAADLFEQFPETRQNSHVLRQLASSVNQPFNMAVVGRMKTGKSTLINSLVGRDLAITDVEEATATINWICYGTGDKTSRFTVHWKNGQTESLPLECLRAEWTGKDAGVKERAERTKFIELFANLDRLKEVQIIDTPGTGSSVDAHEAIISEFISPDVISRSTAEGRRADAIIYVIGPVGRGDDAETLNRFRKERLPNSGAYNSVCALHKWDGLNEQDPAAKAETMASELRNDLSDIVAEVIPVSAPIALAAKAAGDDFFERLLDSCRNVPDSKFSRLMALPERWDEDEQRAACRRLFPIPWASFSLLVRQLRDAHCPDVASARQKCIEYSGIAKLEKFVEERFFSQSKIIKKCRLLEQARQVYGPSIRKVVAEGDRLKVDAERAEAAAKAMSPLRSDLSSWMNCKGHDWNAQRSDISTETLALDREWESRSAELEGLLMDLRVSEAMDRQPDLFPPEHRPIVRELANQMATASLRSQLGALDLVSTENLLHLIDLYRGKANRARRTQQPLFEHVVSRLENAMHLIEATGAETKRNNS